MNQDLGNTENKPLLVYDGDCTFCTYWAMYWQKLTGDAVKYRPYQEVAKHYPDIPITSFQKAVQYITPDGKIASAAEASFLTLSHAKGKSIWLSLYRRLPGFAFLTEKAYAFIAAHRSFFYFITLMLWGRNYEPPRYNLVSWLFLRLLGLIFLSAFISFGVQAIGLIGSKGILPLTELIEIAHNQLGVTAYWLLPNVFWLNSSNFMIQLICWMGAAFSLLLIFSIVPRISLFFLYVFYLSLFYAGQVFMTFQWDLFLLETGVLAFFLVRPSVLGIWLMRWLLFRFIFAAGLVKIFSGDPSWQNFSALSYYFLTEPLPTPLAWYAHHLPQSLLAVATVAALIIELVVPFLIFFPRKIRFFAAYAILLMQIIILITGNYNFFNLLTITLCLVCFDDAAIRKFFPQRLIHFIKTRHTQTVTPHKIISLFAGSFAALTIFISLVQFHLRFVGSVPTPLMWVYNSIEPLRLVNPYGPFAVITTPRMEIIIEGSDDGIQWKEYAFKYKPGDIYRRPLWNIPHQPRLDWQMWFAALSSPQDNFWFLRFLQRILENSSTVLALLEYNPFPDKPPVFIRAQFYDYRFTSSEERKSNGAWWQRELVKAYLPEVRLRAN